MKKNYLTFIKDYGRNRVALIALSAITVGGISTSCSSSEEEEEVVVSEQFEKGVITSIKEVEKDDFKIVDEQISPDGKSYALVEYQDGRKDTLSYALLKELLDKNEVTTTQNTSQDNGSHVYHHSSFGSSLMTAIMFSQMGYMMGNMNSMNRGAYYQNPTVYQRSAGYGQQAAATRSYVSRDARTGSVVATSKTAPRGGTSGSFSKPRSSSSS